MNCYKWAQTVTNVWASSDTLRTTHPLGREPHPPTIPRRENTLHRPRLISSSSSLQFWMDFQYKVLSPTISRSDYTLLPLRTPSTQGEPSKVCSSEFTGFKNRIYALAYSFCIFKVSVRVMTFWRPHQLQKYSLKGLSTNTPWESEVFRVCRDLGKASWFLWFFLYYFSLCWNESGSFPQGSFPWKYWGCFPGIPSLLFPECMLVKVRAHFYPRALSSRGQMLCRGHRPWRTTWNCHVVITIQFLTVFQTLILVSTGKCSSLAKDGVSCL